MKNRKYSKTLFHKMYLIDKDMYNRVLPHLSEVDKQDINEINSGNSTELNEEVTEMEKNNHEAESETKDLTNSAEVEKPDERAEASPFAEETTPYAKPAVTNHKKKTKKYSCSICVNKSFTTKPSMKRHHKTFHEEKQALNADTTQEGDNIIASTPVLKRKFNNEDYDSDDYEHLNKKAKYTQPEGVKRKREIDFDDLEQRKKFLPETGQKRKRPTTIADLQPNKKFHWASY